MTHSKRPADASGTITLGSELAVNFIDTADAYGPFVSEQLIKRALHPNLKGLVIATKDMTRFGLGLSAAMFCVGCAGAQHEIRGQPMPPTQSVAILVTTTPEVDDTDEAGGVATLAETVSEGLKQHGILSQIYTAKDGHPPAPRLELNVLFWRQPGTSSRKLAAGGYVIPGLSVAALVTGGNRMIVECSVFLPGHEQRVFWRRFDKSHLPMMLTETDDTAAAASAGNAIVGDVLAH